VGIGSSVGKLSSKNIKHGRCTFGIDMLFLKFSAQLFLIFVSNHFKKVQMPAKKDNRMINFYDRFLDVTLD